jgi:hypothetical protein
VNRLFAELEKYDPEERAETFEHLKVALNETRESVGAEPITGIRNLIPSEKWPVGFAAILPRPARDYPVYTVYINFSSRDDLLLC